MWFQVFQFGQEFLLFREEVRENQTCDFSSGFLTFLITYNKWKVSEDNAVTFNPSMLFYSVLLHSTPFLLYLRISVMIHPVDWWFISGSCSAVRNWVTQLSSVGESGVCEHGYMTEYASITHINACHINCFAKNYFSGNLYFEKSY